MYRHAIHNYSWNSESYSEWAKLLFESGQCIQAEFWMKQASAMDPSYREGLHALAQKMEAEGQSRASEEAFHCAWLTDPASASSIARKESLVYRKK